MVTPLSHGAILKVQLTTYTKIMAAGQPLSLTSVLDHISQWGDCGKRRTAFFKRRKELKIRLDIPSDNSSVGDAAYSFY